MVRHLSFAGVFAHCDAALTPLVSVEHVGKLFERLKIDQLDAFEKFIRPNHSRHTDRTASFCPRHGNQRVRGFSAAQGGLLLLLFLPIKKTKQPPAKAGGLKSSAESTDTGQRPVIIQF